MAGIVKRPFLEVSGKITESDLRDLILDIAHKVPSLIDVTAEDLVINVVSVRDKATRLPIEPKGIAYVFITGPHAMELCHVLVGLNPDGSRPRRDPSQYEIDQVSLTRFGKPCSELVSWADISEVEEEASRLSLEESHDSRVKFKFGSLESYGPDIVHNSLFFSPRNGLHLSITPADKARLISQARVFNSETGSEYPRIVDRDRFIKVIFDPSSRDAEIAIHFLLFFGLDDGNVIVFQPERARARVRY